MGELMVAVTVALFEADDEIAQQEAWQGAHDYLVQSVPRRLGAVEARTYDLREPGNDLLSLFRDLGGPYADPANQTGFLEAAAAMRHPVAMVTTVKHEALS